MPVSSDDFSMRSVITEGSLSADTYPSLRSLLAAYPPGSDNDSLRDYSSFAFANPQTISLSAASFSPTYGDASFTFTATARTAEDATIPWTAGFSITSNDTGKITVANTGSPSSGVQTFTVTIVGATTSNVTLTIAIASGTVSSVLYNAAQTTATVSVAKAETTAVLSGLQAEYDDVSHWPTVTAYRGATVIATYTDNGSSPANFRIDQYVEGIWRNTAFAEYNMIDLGSYSVRARYNGDSNHNTSNYTNHDPTNTNIFEIVEF